MIGPGENTGSGPGCEPSLLLGIGLSILGHLQAGEWDSQLAEKIQPAASDPYPAVGTERPG